MTQNELDKLAQAWVRLVDCIAHDLKTPIAGMRMTGEAIEQIFPHLLKGYHLAVQHKLVSPEVNENRLKMLEELVVPEIKQKTNNLLASLNLLQPLTQRLLSDSPEVTTLSIKACVQNALKNIEKPELVRLDCKKDFSFQCDPLFINALLANLLDNALLAIARAEKGDIHIWTDEEPDYNVLHFKDTGLGMNEDVLAVIFKRCFSKREDEVVPGLGLCRLAIMQIGGEMICHSVKGEYTEFVIKLRK